MTTKNGDMPAMPFQQHGPHGLPTHEAKPGLSKREMMAMHMMAANRSRSSNYSSWADMATDAIGMTDALLAELEHTK